jgi:hypothetical protein
VGACAAYIAPVHFQEQRELGANYGGLYEDGNKPDNRDRFK